LREREPAIKAHNQRVLARRGGAGLSNEANSETKKQRK
jgi:hypothetical protein